MTFSVDAAHEAIRPHIKTFFDRAIETFGDEIDSIYLYGSVITADYNPKTSDVNSLILFKSFDLDKARRLHPAVKSALKRRIIAPLCLGVETFERSADTFPLEFIEIQDKHSFVYGETDRVAGLVIPLPELRTKLEEQIKGKLIRMRQAYIERESEQIALLDILTDAQKQLMPVYRNLLRFMGEEKPPVNREDALKALDGHDGVTLAPAIRVFDHATGRAPIAKADAAAVYADYVAMLLQLAALIDRVTA
ncbi:MAG: hypothetical protein GC154_13930 [bacterium]|nr:hypothetical protein [bacterium]